MAVRQRVVGGWTLIEVFAVTFLTGKMKPATIRDRERFLERKIRDRPELEPHLGLTLLPLLLAKIRGERLDPAVSHAWQFLVLGVTESAGRAVLPVLRGVPH